MIFSVNRRARMGARFALIGAAVLLLALLAWWIAGRGARPVPTQAAATTAPPATGFRLTAAQWASLKIESVSKVRIDSVVIADGVIDQRHADCGGLLTVFGARDSDSCATRPNGAQGSATGGGAGNRDVAKQQ